MAITETRSDDCVIDLTRDAADGLRAHEVERKLDRWMRGTSTKYDSVVIAGGQGITTLAFAARLARHPTFAGRVVLAGKAKSEDRRLKGGVSLRGYAADFLGYALGLGHHEFVASIDPGRTIPASTRQVAAMADLASDGSWRFSRPGPWQMHRGRSDRPVMYGFRNSRMVVAVRDAIAEGTVQFVDDEPRSRGDARDLALGDHPLLVNCSNDDSLFGNVPGVQSRGIIAAQVPFKVAGELQHPLQEATTFAPLVRREGTIDVGYYTPFQDPLSPEADWYGIIARPVPARELTGVAAEHHKAAVTDEMFGIGEAAGLAAVDPHETLGVAAVAGHGWRAPEPVRSSDTFELRRSCSTGVPAYYADGILCGAMGGLAAAEAIIRGADPAATTSEALRAIRRWNAIWWFETTKLALVADKLMRVSVPMAMVYPHSSSVNSWASMA